ncbi:uncharacterized protein SCHCODRAFT_02615794 [Schizophyllum commune H4-8]|uniref:uncharacterized protein n=1 Tax=Schizophyllum commune (strain H4-8 / FGSC 9210) TaxID=578458 RepID=UPI002160CE24|nr:uncharacterized protein SCHCODRAFT_02615794 [Schizophyllum commune H4-8]KAI5896777.1 hypothetical protein SCHCODRAFT_02615794 [Schizophyllum commune H4-8]
MLRSPSPPCTIPSPSCTTPLARSPSPPCTVAFAVNYHENRAAALTSQAALSAPGRMTVRPCSLNDRSLVPARRRTGRMAGGSCSTNNRSLVPARQTIGRISQSKAIGARVDVGRRCQSRRYVCARVEGRRCQSRWDVGARVDGTSVQTRRSMEGRKEVYRARRTMYIALGGLRYVPRCPARRAIKIGCSCSKSYQDSTFLLEELRRVPPCSLRSIGFLSFIQLLSLHSITFPSSFNQPSHRSIAFANPYC